DLAAFPLLKGNQSLSRSTINHAVYAAGFVAHLGQATFVFFHFSGFERRAVTLLSDCYWTQQSEREEYRGCKTLGNAHKPPRISMRGDAITIACFTPIRKGFAKKQRSVRKSLRLCEIFVPCVRPCGTFHRFTRL